MLRYPSVRSTKSKIAKRRISALYTTEDDVTKKIKVETEVVQHFTLKWKEFLCLAFILETNLFQVVHYVDMSLEYGGLIIFLGYFIFGLTMGISIFASLLFWGHYTQQGYFKFWEMVPLLKGMTWAVSAFSIFYEFFNVSLAGLALSYIPDIFHSVIPWSNCKFEGASNSCFSSFSKEGYNETCKKQINSTMVHFPAYEFLMYNKIRFYENQSEYTGIGELQPPWLISVSCTWCLIFLLLLLEFPRFRMVVTMVAYIFAAIFFVPTFLLMIFISRRFPAPANLRGSAINLSNIEFWLSILCHSFSRKLPGNYILLGSYAPKNLKSNEHVFCIYGMKYVCFLCLTVWLSAGLQLLRLYYKIQDVNCLPISGMILMFAILPDILTRFPLPHVTLFLYFLGLWFFGFLSALFTLTAFLESIIEAIPGIAGVKVYFCAILCTICFLCNMLFVTNLFISTMEAWRENSITILSTTIIFIFSIGIYLYSIQKYDDDFYFTYGKPLGAYWKENLKLVALVAVFFLYIIINHSLHKRIAFITVLTQVLSYIFIAIVIGPIVFVAIFIYTQYKNKYKAVLSITPTFEWGPPTVAKKVARNRFKPQSESRHNRQDQKCQHNCLLHSETLKNEIILIKQNRLRLTEILDIEEVE